jgi:hypothetical protein
MTLRAERISTVAVVLAAFVLRAMVPVGLMPAVDADGNITVALCPGVIASPLPAGEHVHAHSGSAGDHDSNGAPSSKHSVCPFAPAANPTQSPPVLAHLFMATTHVRESQPFTAQIVLPILVRASSPRAPPVL